MDNLHKQRIALGAIGGLILAPLVYYIGLKQMKCNYLHSKILRIIAIVWALAEIYFLIKNTSPHWRKIEFFR